MTERCIDGLRGGAVVLVAVTLGVLSAFVATPAEAHGNLHSSEPPNGAELQAPPDAVILRFTEAPEVRLAVIRVLDVNGSSFERGPPQPIPGDELALRQVVTPLSQGVYTVAWRIVSRIDGHATAGAFAFGVGVSPLDAPSPPALDLPRSPRPSPLEIAGRWIFIVGLVALLGAAVVRPLAFRESPARLRDLMWAAWTASLVGLVGLALAQRGASGVGLGTFLTTTVGRAILWRGGALAGSAVALAAAGLASGRVRRAALTLVAVGAAGAMYAEVAAGHAAASRSLRLLEVASQSVHFVAIGVWIGGLAALLLGIRGAPDEPKAAAIRRFSAAAGVAVAVVAVTGVIRALDEVGSWRGLFTTSYGWVVLAKVGLLLILVALGAMNRYRHVRRARTSLSGLRRVSRAELAVAAVTLVATAILTGISPPRSSSAQAASEAPAGIVVSGSDFATTTRVRLQVTPGFAGVTRFVATVTDFDSGQPVRAERVGLQFSFQDESGVGESVLELKRSANGQYAASGSNLSLDGRWQVTVLVQRATTSVTVPLEVATRCRVRALAAPGQPTIYTADLPNGVTVQQYLDPGVAGLNEVHFTFFDTAGNELRVDALPTVTSSRSGEASVQIEVRRFSPGHFIANAELAAGRWRFQVVSPFRVCFEESVRRS